MDNCDILRAGVAGSIEASPARAWLQRCRHRNFAETKFLRLAPLMARKPIIILPVSLAPRPRSAPRTASRWHASGSAEEGNELSQFYNSESTCRQPGWGWNPGTARQVAPSVGDGRTMRRHDNYRRVAAECLKLARTSKDAETKAVLVQMAQLWARLADEGQRPNEQEEVD